MANICVIYASENKLVVERLISYLRQNWVVWWDGDHHQGDWEQEVRNQIHASEVVIAVFSSHTNSKNIFKDELYFAYNEGKPIYPFFIEEVTPFLGFGCLTRTYAIGWDGDANHPGLEMLRKRIAAKIGISFMEDSVIERKYTLSIKVKSLKLPNFIFSLSSHETQVSPKDGVELFKFLEPDACLISAYDVYHYIKDKNRKKSDKERFLDSIGKIQKSSSVLILDSGNYEAYRKNNRYSIDNKRGWKNEHFLEVFRMITPDIAFSYDELEPYGEIDDIANNIIENYYKNKEAIGEDTILCPIIHLPDNTTNVSANKANNELMKCASQLAVKISSELKPIMIAIPERELGSGIKERAKTVQHIREALNGLSRYYPLHLLGTGNPITMVAMAAAGADSFDGLEWCRTVADYDSGCLFHFQHFDLFKKLYINKLYSQLNRVIIKNPDASYITQVAVYNIDFFNHWVKIMQNMIETNQAEYLLKSTIPNIGGEIFKEILKNENRN